MQPVIIVGNSVIAQIIYKFIAFDDRYEVVAFASDKKYIKDNKLFKLDVVDIEQLKDIFDMKIHKVIIAIGYNNLNTTREKIFNKIKKLGFEIETYIHREAKIYSLNSVGIGSLIMPNVIIEPFTKVGQNTVIWSNSIVSHHSIVEDHCWISTSVVLAGNVKIKNNCYLGVGVRIAYKVIVESFNIIDFGTMIKVNTNINEVYTSESQYKHTLDSMSYAGSILK